MSCVVELAPLRLETAACAEIVNVEFPKLTSHIFSAVNFEYNPVFSLSTIIGVANEIEDEVFIPTEPSFTPATVAIPATVKVFKSGLMAVTLLKLISEVPAVWYCMIESVFIPLNALPGDVIDPVTPSLEVIILLLKDCTDCILVVSNIVSASKDIDDVDWDTDFISWIPYALTLAIDLNVSPLLVSIINFSLGIKAPDVWDRTISFAPDTEALINPVAPLLSPLTKELIFAVKGVFKVIKVYVWTSNKWRFHWLEASSYGLFLNPNEYTLAFPISYSPDIGSSLLLENKLITLVFPMPTSGVPFTLLTLNMVPISKGTKALEIFSLSLGLSKSIIFVPGWLILKPFTYAFPELTSRQPKSSDGVLPCSVTSLDLNIPPFESPVSKESATFTSKLSKE